MVAPDPTISRAAVADLDAVFELLDAEFISGKGHRHSLRLRFAHLFEVPNRTVFLQAHAGELLVASLAIRRFDWITRERSWRAAMIGLVCTRPEWRGKGIAGALMREAMSAMALDADFAVLWAAHPAFYARLGWQGADCGMLGQTGTADPGTNAPLPSPDANSIEFVEALRDRFAPERVSRTPLAYSALLPHAESVELLRADAAYAIVGRNGSRGYLYELLGDAPGLRALWAQLRTRYSQLFLNLRSGSAEQRFLSAQPDVRWQAQALAMWLPLSEDARLAPFSDWYVPFLDRI
jgi:predicted N-acetyltransferase YhbS